MELEALREIYVIFQLTHYKEPKIDYFDSVLVVVIVINIFISIITHHTLLIVETQTLYILLKLHSVCVSVCITKMIRVKCVLPAVQPMEQLR